MTSKFAKEIMCRKQGLPARLSEEVSSPCKQADKWVGIDG